MGSTRTDGNYDVVGCSLLAMCEGSAHVALGGRPHRRALERHRRLVPCV